MKNATKHADKLKSLFRTMLRDGKPPQRETLDPLRALVIGAISSDVTESRATEAMKHLDAEFVDLNELRVATDLEIQGMLGAKFPGIEKRVEMITKCLNAIFEKEHTLSLDRLKTVSRRDARHFLHGLPDINPFVEAWVMLYAFDGAAVPVDSQIAQYLRDQGVAEKEAPIDEVQKFVEHHLKAEECYDFFYCVRRAAAEDGKGKKKSKS